MEEKITETVEEQNVDSTAKQPDKKKKILNVLYRTAAAIAVIAVFALFIYLLIYSFNNDGADWLRKIA